MSGRTVVGTGKADGIGVEAAAGSEGSATEALPIPLSQ